MSGTGPRWKYAAENAAGAVVSGIVEAASETAAVAILRERRLLPIAVASQRHSRLGALAAVRDPNGLSIKDLAAIARRLSDLLNAGLPLARAVDLGRRHAGTEKQRGFFEHVAHEIGAGKALSAAMASGQARPPRLMLAIVRAGENVGALPAHCAKLSAHYEELLRLRRDITNQLVYPAALMVLIVLTLIFLSFFVLPQFESIFETAGATPPIETRLALAGGAFIRGNIVFAPAALLAALLTWRAAKARYAGAFDRLLLRVPIIGSIRRDAEIGRYARALSTLLEGGMSLSDAMPLATETIASPAVRAAAEGIERHVRTGGRLADAVARFASPSPEIVSFLEVGEEAGDLAAMAGEAARFAEIRASSAIKKAMSLLGPVLTAIMGLVTAAVIAAVMSGVLSLNEAVL